MALPSGTFSHANSGRLQVSFRGKWTTNSGSDWGNGALNLVLRAYVGTKTAILHIQSTTAVLEVPYTGGTNVAVGLEEVTHSFSGPSSISATELECVCRLFAS